MSAPLLPLVTSLSITSHRLLHLPSLPHTITDLLLCSHDSADIARLSKLTGLTKLR